MLLTRKMYEEDTTKMRRRDDEKIITTKRRYELKKITKRKILIATSMEIRLSQK